MFLPLKSKVEFILLDFEANVIGAKKKLMFIMVKNKIYFKTVAELRDYRNSHYYVLSFDHAMTSNRCL